MEIGCICPPKSDGQPRHISDKVTFREKMPFLGGLAARNEMSVLMNEDPEASAGERLAVIGPLFLFYGIEDWTLRDDKNKDVEVSRSAIRALLEDHPNEGQDLVTEANRLYLKAVLDPLADRASSSSPPTSTSVSTSPTTGSSPTPLKRPKRSSTSTTQTGGTERMSASPGGDFN
jgi:hypothetical protein